MAALLNSVRVANGQTNSVKLPESLKRRPTESIFAALRVDAVVWQDAPGLVRRSARAVPAERAVTTKDETRTREMVRIGLFSREEVRQRRFAADASPSVHRSCRAHARSVSMSCARAA